MSNIWLKKTYRNMRKCVIVNRLFKAEKKITYRSVKNNNEAEILLLCHALEKGMGVRNVKKGYGKEKAVKLIEILATIKDAEGMQSYAYCEGVAVLKAYIDFQNACNENIDNIINLFDSYGFRKESDYAAGFVELSKEELEKGEKFDFYEFVKSKHSIRMFSPEPMSQDVFREAVKCALCAPSACNRQPCKVYYSLDSEQNRILGKMVPGNKSFENDVPYYCVIAVDRSFFGEAEVFQWYMNGGIFVTYLTLALHAHGIGSCIFQWPDFYETEAKVREHIGMKEAEAIVAVVGYGKYLDKTKCICAQRKSENDISRVF